MIHRLGSGTYNVRKSEDIPPPPSTTNKSILKKHVKFIGQTNSNNSTSTIPCTVHFLDDTFKEFQVAVKFFLGFRLVFFLQ